MKTLTLRLPDDEYLLINAEAEKRLTSITSLLRLYIRTLQPTVQAPTNPHHPQPGQPVPDALKLKPFDSVLNNEAMLCRYEEGYKTSQVAEHAGLPPYEVQTRIAKARTARADGSLAKAQRRKAFDDAFVAANPKPTPNHSLCTVLGTDGEPEECYWQVRERAKTAEEKEAEYLAMEREVLEKLGVKPPTS